MLSLLGREARRSPGIRCLVRPSIETALAGPQTSCQSRLFGTSDLCIYGCEEPSRRDVLHGAERGEGAKGVVSAVHSLPTARTVWEAWRWASPVGKWGESAFSLKVAETLQGARQAATDVLSRWASPIALGSGQPALLPQSLERDQGYEEGVEEGEGLFEGGLWATSVRRKRVTKMRKHKWRKRRKLERQSASRRVNK